MNLHKRDLHKIIFHLRSSSADYFGAVILYELLTTAMDSRASRDFLLSSDEEGEDEIFAGFTVEEIAQLQEQQRRKEVLSVGEDDNSSSENGDLEVEEIDNASDVDIFVDEEEGEEYSSDQSSEEEEGTDAVQWSSTLSEINVEPFAIAHGRQKILDQTLSQKIFSIIL